jgi:diaminopimelate epimerase
VKFHKYQALGNDYLVLEGFEGAAPDPGIIQRLCDRHRGVGSDGVLVGGRGTQPDQVALRIFNPDGSEAEKSGNGLRIFARYAWDRGLVQSDVFTVLTKGGGARCEVREGGRSVFAEMGEARFSAVDEVLDLGDEQVRFTAVSVGNPHCVVQVDDPTPELARRLGPRIESHPLFPNRTNVQLVKVTDRHRIQLEIWERGAGYTLASGTSSCAAAAASVRLGLCAAGEIAVTAPGGTLTIGVSDRMALTLLGPVRKIAEGTISPEMTAP